MSTIINPILNGDYPDPSMVRVGDDYYLTYSCEEYTPGLHILHSKDLIHWKTLGYAMVNMGCIMAPELIYMNQKFYLYFPANGTNYVTTADNPAGPWSMPIDLKIGGIDPGHVVGPDGTRYLYVNQGYAFRLSTDGLYVEESLGKRYDGWDYDPRLFHTEGKWLESPKIFKRNDMYYLISAQGGTAGPSTAHMCVCARAADPLGPWENAPANPLVHTKHREEHWWCKGYGTVLEAADGTWVIVYHAYEKDYLNHGRKILLQQVNWTEDGWPVVDDNPDTPFDIETTCIEQSVNEFCDDFNFGKPLPFWAFWNHYDSSRLLNSSSGLFLKGKGTSPSDAEPLTIPCGLKAYEMTVDAVSLKIVNNHHDVSYEYKLPDGEWIHLDYGCEVSGINHNTLGGFRSLRPGLFACGEGCVHFSHFMIKE